MQRNGSPKPVFATDEERTYFLVRLPVHPKVIELEQESDQVRDQAPPEVIHFLSVLKGDMSRTEIMAALTLKDEKHFREYYQQAAIAQRLIEMTIPDKPRSRLQKYRLTDLGKRLLEQNQ